MSSTGNGRALRLNAHQHALIVAALETAAVSAEYRAGEVRDLEHAAQLHLHAEELRLLRFDLEACPPFTV